MKGPTKSRFETIFSQGLRVSGPLARLAFVSGEGLVGFATSKKIGGRPQRNRAKRRFREALRTQPELLDRRLDMVFVVGVAGATAPFGQIADEVRALVSRARSRWESESESS